MIRFMVTVKDQLEESGFMVQVSKSDLMCNTRDIFVDGYSKVLAINKTIAAYLAHWGIEAND